MSKKSPNYPIYQTEEFRNVILRGIKKLAYKDQRSINWTIINGLRVYLNSRGITVPKRRRVNKKTETV